MTRPAPATPDQTEPLGTRARLVDAALRLAALGDAEGVSVRAIARAAGVTEGALYKHFDSKDALWRDAYEKTVEEMATMKARLVERALPARESLREWVRLSYERFDHDPDAFRYVLLRPPAFASEPAELYHRQGRLFRELIRRGQERGEIRALDEGLIVALFSGLLLSVPRAIDEGLLEGLAVDRVDEVVEAAWRLIGAAES